MVIEPNQLFYWNYLKKPVELNDQSILLSLGSEIIEEVPCEKIVIINVDYNQHIPISKIIGFTYIENKLLRSYIENQKIDWYSSIQSFLGNMWKFSGEYYIKDYELSSQLYGFPDIKKTLVGKKITKIEFESEKQKEDIKQLSYHVEIEGVEQHYRFVASDIGYKCSDMSNLKPIMEKSEPKKGDKIIAKENIKGVLFKTKEYIIEDIFKIKKYKPDSWIVKVKDSNTGKIEYTTSISKFKWASNTKIKVITENSLNTNKKKKSPFEHILESTPFATELHNHLNSIVYGTSVLTTTTNNTWTTIPPGEPLPIAETNTPELLFFLDEEDDEEYYEEEDNV